MSIRKVWATGIPSLATHITYAIGNCAAGFLSYSWWFVTMGAYYAVLAIARFSVLQVRRRACGDRQLELFASRIAGILLVILSFCLTGIITLSAVEQRGQKFHEILMITIALCTFIRIVLAFIHLIRDRRSDSAVTKTLRSITLADAFVSVYALQQSMLVSFPGMRETDIQLFNILTGTAVWLIVLLLGIYLIGGKHVTMAKSKIAKANEKIASTVVSGYKQVEQGVVNAYKQVEHGAVSTYQKIEDKFVETYLTREGETVEDAKARLKKDSGEE